MKFEAMLWMLILASLAVAIVSRKYRQYGLVVLGIAVVTVVAVIVLVGNNEILPAALPGIPAQQAKRVDFEQSHVEKLDREEPDAKDRIGVSEIRFDQIRPSGDSEAGTIASIRARLYNDSARFTLTDYAYYLAVQDCVDQVCTTIYDQRGLESTMVPAAQARDVMIAIRAHQSRESPLFKLLGTPKIILSPTGTRAYNSLIPQD
ncbi:MAG TPA: hypothetical protein VGO37_10220 [Steroidobacteraceae bacterium]|jgi:hypothetical protein|nr:hypothetical protein [Steroidobacteraceae bacterium]